MQASLNTDVTREALRAEFESLEGIRRAFIDGPPWEVFLVCDPAVSNPAEVEIAVRMLLAKTGFAAGEVELHLSFVAPPPRRQRVRFLRAALDTQNVTRAVATVALEWDGVTVEERAEGDASPVGVLRLCATATIGALEALIGEVLRFDLIGIKSVHVFDSDLIVVLLRTHHAPQHQLIGATLVSADPYHSAARAVLNATNRILGNYLNVSEDGEP